MQHGGVPELLLALAYNGTTGRLTAEVVKGSHFRNLALNKAPDTYIKLCLVSSMGLEMAKAKTSTRRGQPNPLFKESFVFQVSSYTYSLSIFNLMTSAYFLRLGCFVSIERCYIDGIGLCKAKYEKERNGWLV